MSLNAPAPAAPARSRVPRLGFLGVGWIGRHRMAALAQAGLAHAVAMADRDPAALQLAAEAVPGIAAVDNPGALLDADLDGLVIATPSALHAQQAMEALEHGLAVFCQKPLGRTAAEARAVVQAARRHDRLLGVDLSYRHLRATAAARRAIASGELGEVYALDLIFHNAYGPDKPWFTDRRQSGGGCVIDLGTHLVDLALWLTGADSAAVESARLLAHGRPLSEQDENTVEDFALVQLRTDGGATARVACSWFLPVGRDCEIQCTAYGTAGGISIRNVAGSFYDFTAHRHRGTASEMVAEPPDTWGPRAISAWAAGLARGGRYDPEVESAVRLATVLDEIYGAAR